MKSILFFPKILKIFKKRAENEYLHPNGTPEVSHKWKSPKIRIFALNSRCASWVSKHFFGHFWLFFQKTNDLKKIFAKKNFLDFGHLAPYFKTKNAKNGDFRLKMATSRNFCGRNCGFWGWGGRKKFGPHQKYSKVFPKKFWGRGTYLGPLWPRKSQKMAILGQKWHIAEISVAGNRGGRGGAAEKFSARAQKSQKFFQKNFQVHTIILTHLTKISLGGEKNGDFFPPRLFFYRFRQVCSGLLSWSKSTKNSNFLMIF